MGTGVCDGVGAITLGGIAYILEMGVGAGYSDGSLGVFILGVSVSS